MIAGVMLAQWFANQAERVYQVLTETPEGRARRRVCDWISSKGGKATVRQVQAGCRWLREPGEAEKALADLVKHGLGTWQDLSPSPQGGRPTRVFSLNAVNETPVEPESFEVSLTDGSDNACEVNRLLDEAAQEEEVKEWVV